MSEDHKQRIDGANLTVAKPSYGDHGDLPKRGAKKASKKTTKKPGKKK